MSIVPDNIYISLSQCSNVRCHYNVRRLLSTKSQRKQRQRYLVCSFNRNREIFRSNNCVVIQVGSEKSSLHLSLWSNIYWNSTIEYCLTFISCSSRFASFGSSICVTGNILPTDFNREKISQEIANFDFTSFLTNNKEEDLRKVFLLEELRLVTFRAE